MVKIGHRGARGYLPENTMLSFKKAIELGADMIEFDVHRCRTGELVVVHDDAVDRTTNGKGSVRDMTKQEIRLLDAGMGEKIPVFEEVLEMVNRRVMVNIELKGKGTAKLVCEAIKRYVEAKGWLFNDFLVSSFHAKELEEVSYFDPRIRIGVLTRNVRVNFDWVVNEIHAYSIHVSRKAVQKRFVSDCHQKGLKIFVFTVNILHDIRRLRSMGVDGIFSDFPDRLLSV